VAAIAPNDARGDDRACVVNSDEVRVPPGQALGAVTLALLAMAADRWAAGDECAALRLVSGAWRLVGDGEFVDDRPLEGSE
jgi:hypothetical protein